MLMRFHLLRGMSPMVRMLWVRSASLMRMTRTSLAMASSILRNDSAWFCSRVSNSSLFQLGQPVDQFGHGRAKALHQVFFGDAAVFDGVVHQRRHQGLGVELPFGALRCDRDGVRDVRVTALAHLAQMGLIGKSVGLPDRVRYRLR